MDADTQLILAQAVGQSPNDARQLEPMVEQVKATAGLLPQELSADSGYVACLFVQALPRFPERARQAFAMLDEVEGMLIKAHSQESLPT